MSLNARGVKTPDLVASLESYNSCRSHFPNLTRWESEKSLRKADFLDFWNLGTQFLPPKWRSRTISSSKTQKYWQTIFIRLCGVYKQATNPVYLSFRPRHHDLIIKCIVKAQIQRISGRARKESCADICRNLDLIVLSFWPIKAIRHTFWAISRLIHNSAPFWWYIFLNHSLHVIKAGIWILEAIFRCTELVQNRISPR